MLPSALPAWIAPKDVRLLPSSWASSAVTAAILLKAALISAQAKAICFFINALLSWIC